MVAKWAGNAEPPLSEVLDEPIVRAIMESDGVDQDDLFRKILLVRNAICERRGGLFPASCL